LRRGGYRLLDTQFVTAHLERFGVIEIPRQEYRSALAHAITSQARFTAEVTPAEVEVFLKDCSREG
jgi:leucyl/phenylalanyl-tRNA--protein transferase